MKAARLQNLASRVSQNKGQAAQNLNLQALNQQPVAVNSKNVDMQNLMMPPFYGPVPVAEVTYSPYPWGFYDPTNPATYDIFTQAFERAGMAEAEKAASEFNAF